MRNSLKFKVGFYLVMALTLAVFVFALLVVRNNREVLLEQAVTHNAQLTSVVIKSTRWAMLQNLPSHVDKIIEDVAVQQDIEKVRILSKNGTIIHSSAEDEIGAQVDQEAESCLACHLDPESVESSPMIGRPRFFTDPSGRRMLGSTAVIRNDLTCSTSGCHADAAHQSVLGVVDVVSPLGKIDQTLRTNTLTIIGLSIGFIILAGLLVSYLVHRMIYQPLHDLEVGSSRLASGNHKQTIPVRSTDEFGQLAESFNSCLLYTSDAADDEYNVYISVVAV